MISRKTLTLILIVICATTLSFASAKNNKNKAKKNEKTESTINESAPLIADSTSIVDDINNDTTSTIEIIQPSELNARIIESPQHEEKKDETPKNTESKKKKEKVKEGKKNITTGKRVAYTIIAFNKPNQREKAYEIARLINSKCPGLYASVKTNLPYWRVEVGPIYDESDAKKALSKIRSIPGTSPTIRKKNIVITR